jgi:hypothetical protein
VKSVEEIFQSDADTPSMNECPGVFAYWDGDPPDALADFKREWREAFPQFVIFGNDEVKQALDRIFPSFVEIYDSIRIPAAKADIARLILLYEFGGLYVDCHCGIVDAKAIEKNLSLLSDIEAILIDRRLAQVWRPPDEHFFINAIMFGKRKSRLFFMMARQALANFECHREFERLFGHIPYHISALSGPRFITSMALQPISARDIRPDFEEKILIIREEDAPVARNRHRSYGGLGRHWSERQQTELLFS